VRAIDEEVFNLLKAVNKITLKRMDDRLGSIEKKVNKLLH
jgi:hypothetical protein